MTTVALLAFSPGASATLRSPQIHTTCPSGYTYGEHTFVNWTVEGCSKSVSLTSREKPEKAITQGPGTGGSGTVTTKKRDFDGKVEVNGMIFELSGTDLTASVTETGDTTKGHLDRTTSTTIVFDPLVSGVRKRFVMYTGSINLDTTEQGGGAEADTSFNTPAYGAILNKGKPAAKHGGAHGAAVVGIGTDYVDIPTSGSPKIFGLSLNNGINDAGIRPQNGSIAATTEFNAELGLSSSGLSDLLDVNANETIKLTDGTGMVVTNLRLDFPDISVPGIGGLEDLYISYKSASDSWEGGLDLDLGSLIGELDFVVEVSASTGQLLYIETSASDLPPIPIGTTGIILDSVQFAFGLDPLFIEAGADATAGPEIGGTSLILIGATIRMEFEPSFRLEVTGTARVLPSGSGELASGTAEVIYDADGLISISGDVRFEATVAGIGIGASIGGSGAYSTTSTKFNISAFADGDLLLGFLGDFNVAHAEAVVSSRGFGVCAKLLGFLSGGIGQVWDDNLEVFTGCDLGPYDVNVTRARTAQDGTRSRRFKIARGTKKAAIELTADRPGPHVTLKGPNGSTRLVSATGDRRQVDSNAVVLGKPDANQQVIALQNPPAGEWTVEWGPDDPQITGLRIARNAPEVKATAKVSKRKGRAGQRRVTVKRRSKLLTGEKLQYAIRTRRGLVELGEPTTASTFTANFNESTPGKREIVAMVVRNGVPLPGRTKVIGSYRATLPERPAKISKRRRGHKLTVKARMRKGAEAPEAWQYVFDAGKGRKVMHRAKVGKSLTIGVPRYIKKVKVTARPVVQGRALR